MNALKGEEITFCTPAAELNIIKDVIQCSQHKHIYHLDEYIAVIKALDSNQILKFVEEELKIKQAGEGYTDRLKYFRKVLSR